MASWRKVCKGCKAKRLRRACLQFKWARWDQSMQEMWQKDDKWRAKWDKEIHASSMMQEKMDKGCLTERIKEGTKDLGNVLRIKWESEEEYNGRLQRKGYQRWKEEKKADGKRKGTKWGEPMPNWREFRLYLRFGRRWKAVWLKRKELTNARQRLRFLEEEQQVSSVLATKDKQLNDVHANYARGSYRRSTCQRCTRRNARRDTRRDP